MEKYPSMDTHVIVSEKPISWGKAQVGDVWVLGGCCYRVVTIDQAAQYMSVKNGDEYRGPYPFNHWATSGTLWRPKPDEDCW